MHCPWLRSVAGPREGRTAALYGLGGVLGTVGVSARALESAVSSPSPLPQ